MARGYLIGKLGVVIMGNEREIIVNIMTLSEEAQGKVDPLIWAQEGNRRGVHMDPLKVTLKNPGEVIHQIQYNITLEGRMGLKPMVEGLLKGGEIFEQSF